MATRTRYPQTNLIRIAPDLLITDDPSIIRHMNSARSPYHRDTWYHSFRVDPQSHNMFSTTDEALHAHLKAKTAPAYTGKDVPTLESDMDGQIAFKSLIREKYLSTGQETRLMDLGKAAQYFTLDAITKIAFGTAGGFCGWMGMSGGFCRRWRMWRHLFWCAAMCRGCRGWFLVRRFCGWRGRGRAMSGGWGG